MRKNKKLHPAIQKTVEISARFGFVSKKIFFEQISTGKEGMTYRLWRRIKTDGLFESLADCYDWNLFRHTRKGRELARSQGLKVVGRPFHKSVQRDVVLMSMVVSLESEGLVLKPVWSQTYSKDFTPQFYFMVEGWKNKAPALYFTLNTIAKSIRVAVEYEQVTKNSQYYRQLFRNHDLMGKADMILFIVERASTEATIRRFCKKTNYRFERRPLAFAFMSDVEKEPSSFQIRMQHRAAPFRAFVHELREAEAKAA